MNRFHPTVSWQESSPHSNSLSKRNKNKTSCEELHWSNDNDEFGLQNARSALRSPQTFFVPMHYEQNYQYPLIVWLHSDGFNENQVEHVMPHVSTRNYLATGIRGIRAADSLGHRFDWHDSAASIDAAHEKVLCAIDEVSDRYSVHQSRIVLAGYRSGGTMALRLALRDPQRFAGVVSLGGRLPQGNSAFGNLEAIRERRLSMLWQYALERSDFDVADLQADIRQAMMLQAKVEVRQYRNDDEMNTATLADLNQWIMNRIVCGQPLSADESWESSPTCFSAN